METVSGRCQWSDTGVTTATVGPEGTSIGGGRPGRQHLHDDDACPARGMHALALAFLSMSVLHAVYTSQITFFEHSLSYCAVPWVVATANLKSGMKGRALPRGVT